MVSLDHPHNLINCSSYHCRAVPNISSKSVNKCLSNITNRQTDRQTSCGKNITSLVEVKSKLMLHFKEQDMEMHAQLVSLL